MIINDWSSGFTAKYGHVFPASYLCIDTEYTGGDHRNDLIVEIGHTMVEDGKVIDERNLILNWYGYPGITAEWFTYKLNTMRSVVGPGWRLTPDVVKQEGIDPLRALKFYDKLFSVWRERELPFVAQNGQNADERILRGNFNRFLNKDFSLPDNAYFDTGAIYKANKVWQTLTGDIANFRSVMLPTRSDTLKTYFNRVINARVPGVKWSLSLIINEFGLMEKHAISATDFHSAGFDSLCLHWIMEEFRRQVKPKQVIQTSPAAGYAEEKEKFDTQAKQAQDNQPEWTRDTSLFDTEKPKIVPSARPKRKQRLI